MTNICFKSIVKKSLRKYIKIWFDERYEKIIETKFIERKVIKINIEYVLAYKSIKYFTRYEDINYIFYL